MMLLPGWPIRSGVTAISEHLAVLLPPSGRWRLPRWIIPPMRQWFHRGMVPEWGESVNFTSRGTGTAAEQDRCFLLHGSTLLSTIQWRQSFLGEFRRKIF